MILGKWPTWHTIIFYVFIYIFNSLHVSSTSCSSSGETNCVNTTSGSCRWPCRVRGVSETTRGCIDTICLSWRRARCARNMYRVKNINKYIEKNFASRWSFTKNHTQLYAYPIFSPKSQSQLECLSYRGTSFYIPCWYQSVQAGRGATQTLMHRVPGHYRGKTAGAWRSPPLHLAPMLK